MIDDLADEYHLPALYMVYPPVAPSPQIEQLNTPPDYRLISVRSEEIVRARPAVELDGQLSEDAWRDYVLHALPNGVFVIEHRDLYQWVGSASAVHNPQGGRFYFPGGGALAYLAVAPLHRGRGLGANLVCAVVRRLRAAEYYNIWLGVQGWRLPAIRTYLNAGFVPFLHAPEPNALLARWERIFAALNIQFDSADWPTSLPAPGRARNI